MAALFLREADVDKLLTMEAAIEAVRTAFRKQATTEVANIPRGRARTDHCMLHIMGAAAKTLGVMALKVYTTSSVGARFLVHLYDGRTGELLSVMEADRLGAMRTGAVTGVATEHMARQDANTVGVFGSGKQARTQLEAVCETRPILEAYVYSPRPERRDPFAAEMSAALGVEVVSVAKPELAAEDKDIIITATSSREPVLRSDWISDGTHLNVIGSNFLGKAEVDIDTIRRSDPIVVDDKEQARGEAGDFQAAMDEGVIRWSDVSELCNVVIGRSPARHADSDVTIFKSVGVAFCDLAVAKLVYDKALEAGAGEPLPF
jgi:ornithine cyclodeaminase/alanine dehydrogenase-like protein (mu-crystallin family)